jgi:LPXTG-motif cell wall-anchored protein
VGVPSFTPSAPPRLPETGTDPLAVVLLGAALLAAGAGLVTAARRRRA